MIFLHCCFVTHQERNRTNIAPNAGAVLPASAASVARAGVSAQLSLRVHIIFVCHIVHSPAPIHLHVPGTERQCCAKRGGGDSRICGVRGASRRKCQIVIACSYYFRLSYCSFPCTDFSSCPRNQTPMLLFHTTAPMLRLTRGRRLPNFHLSWRELA